MTGTYTANRLRQRFIRAFSSLVHLSPLFLCFIRTSMNPWAWQVSLLIISIFFWIWDLKMRAVATPAVFRGCDPCASV